MIKFTIIIGRKYFFNYVTQSNSLINNITYHYNAKYLLFDWVKQRAYF